MSKHRIQIRFVKQGDLRMISHRDLVRTMERLFRRADLDLAMSEGFHPRPKMSFPSALAVGIAALDEVMELELNQPVDKDELLERLRQQEVPGLEFQSVRVLNSTERKGQLKTTTYEFAVPVERRGQTVVNIEEFLARPQCFVNRPKRSAPVDIRAGVQHLELKNGTLHISLSAGREASVRPRDVLEVLGLADLEQQGEYLTRTQVELAYATTKDK